MAAFGAGDRGVEVRAVDPRATDVTSLRHHDPASARSLGTSLARNDDLTFVPNARALLVAGDVDERVMTTLVAVGAAQPIEIRDFPADPAETAAGEARRSWCCAPTTRAGPRRSPASSTARPRPTAPTT